MLNSDPFNEVLNMFSTVKFKHKGEFEENSVLGFLTE